MKIKSFLFVFLMSMLSLPLFAQSAIEEILREGYEYHENGDFDKAVATYQKALEIDPESSLVNYEIALSYFNKGDLENTIKYSDIVLAQNEDYLLQAYMTKGSALDMQGKADEAIQLFKEAIERTEAHYLLYYNLGLTYYNIHDLENAEENIINAIENNSNHPSSHLILAHIHQQKKNTVQTLLATYYFLLLEPNSPRSKDAFLLIEKTFSRNVTKDDQKPNTININFSPNEDNPFTTAELMISLLEAAKYTEKNEGKTEDELFVENTESFFKILGELKKKENKEIWWTLYTDFFYALAESEHLETFCKYISLSSNENAKEWLTDNEQKFLDFAHWLQD